MFLNHLSSVNSRIGSKLTEEKFPEDEDEDGEKEYLFPSLSEEKKEAS